MIWNVCISVEYSINGISTEDNFGYQVNSELNKISEHTLAAIILTEL